MSDDNKINKKVLEVKCFTLNQQEAIFMFFKKNAMP